ncbi:MAG: hypothetical protein GF350_10160, partial [Chitinivibrionales bacterium]|nr:hypothetical protein [Chitinivibrionales bacterium]
MSSRNDNLRKIPGIDSLLDSPELKNAVSAYGRDVVVYSARAVVA